MSSVFRIVLFFALFIKYLISFLKTNLVDLGWETGMEFFETPQVMLMLRINGHRHSVSRNENQAFELFSSFTGGYFDSQPY